VKARIEYFKNVLTLLIHDGMTSQERYEICLRVENVFLPQNGYFGLSATTGGLADDHDVLSFMVHSLKTPDEIKPPATAVPQPEKEKIDAEFKNTSKILKRKKKNSGNNIQKRRNRVRTLQNFTKIQWKGNCD